VLRYKRDAIAFSKYNLFTDKYSFIVSSNYGQRAGEHNYGLPPWVKSATLLLISLAVLGPILPGIQTSLGKLFPFRLFLPVYIAILAAAISSYSQDKIRFPRIIVPLFMLMCLGIFSFLYAVSAGKGFQTTQLIVILTRWVLLISIIIVIDTRDWIYRAWTVLIGLFLLAMIVALFEHTTGWHFAGSQIHRLPDRAPYSTWVTAWYTNVNDFAFFILMTTIPALVLGLTPTTDSRIRVFSIAVWTIGASLTVHLRSRAVILAYIIVVTTAFGLTHVNTIRRIVGRIPRRIGKVAPPIFGFVLAGLFILMPNPVMEHGSSLWMRWQLQKAAVLEGGFWGNGFGSSPVVISQSSIDTGGIASPHSWYGAFITDTGVLGLTLFLVFYGSLVAGIARTTNLRDPISIISITSLIALPVAGLGSSNAIILPMFWIVLGLSISTFKLHLYDE